MFVKSGNLSLINGGYLVEGSENNPVYHEEFVRAQREAHFLVKLSEKVSKADFKGKGADSFEQIKKEVLNEIANSNRQTYLSLPAKPETNLTDKLQEEALNWLNYKKAENKTESINEKMQNFNIIKEYEDFGLYFTHGVVKLKEIYTTEQIVTAMTILSDHLV